MNPAEIALWTYQNDVARAAYYADLAVMQGICGTCQERKAITPYARICRVCRDEKRRVEARESRRRP